MLKFAQIADQIAATTKKLQKTALLADYFKSVPVEEAAVAAMFFSGRPFPMWEETTLQVGGTQLWRIVSELSGKSDQELTAAYREHGDLGAVAEVVLPKKQTWSDGQKHGDLRDKALVVLPNEQTWSDGRPRPSDGEYPAYPPTRVLTIFRHIASARGPAAKGALVRDLLSSVSPLEAKYIVKIITGDLRIGLKESLVEEAIAKAYEAPLPQVQRANMLLGDIGETLKLAADTRLAEAKMRLFHPIGFMLASPAESADDALSYFQNAWIEDKYDGIRAQAHCSGDTVRFFSRTRDEITESFPELPDALVGLPEDAILDGEILAWSYLGGAEQVEGRASSPVEQAATVGRALPFSALQQRLGRKKVSDKLMQQVPAAYLVFDLLYAGAELLIDMPLRERAEKLEQLLSAPRKAINHRGHRGTQSNTEPQHRFDFDARETVGTELVKDLSDAERTTDLRTTYDERRTSILPRTESQEPRAVPPTTDGRYPTAALRTTYDERRTSIVPTTNGPTTPRIIRAPVFHASSPDELNQLFDAAQARGNEGLMIKDPESPYTPGRRGKSWLKLKRELATLDVVVTAVEWGHGKRIGVLSDYTFAVRDGDRLLNVGKAYSGLTDIEITEMTKWFLDHTIEDHGFRRTVEPKIVLEVAFNNVMKSDRHNSGYALRFPRIVRLRPDKLPEEADTLGRVKEIYASQEK